MKFSPKFQLIDGTDDSLSDDEKVLPYMKKQLPRARYPYSSVVFSMWGNNDKNTNVHYGALEVVEKNDSKYVSRQSFTYDDILETC